MKKTVTLGLMLLLCNLLAAQQWIDEKYTYDSTLNVVYGTATGFAGRTDTLRMDIYSPVCGDAQQISRRPLMLVIHGGAFLEGSKEDPNIVALCKSFARRGYVTAGINYRLGFVSDDTARTCNYPNYNCVFATDTAEWYRAYYRGIQDAKGALRFLVNRNQYYRIDTANVFVTGESAGAFISLGVALMDTAIEKPAPCGNIAAAANPHSSMLSCSYNLGQSFSAANVLRPDLGSIDGTIEPSTIQYTIKGVGNFYGAMLTDLLQYHKANAVKPVIYSFHRPCDPVVPIDQGHVYEYLNWCFTNGYNCYSIRNTPIVRGSRAFSNLNTSSSYGYTIHDEFTSINFPFSYLIGSGSCIDQVNNPCHAIDNYTLRSGNLATFFAGYVSTNPVCDTGFFPTQVHPEQVIAPVEIFPNPFSDQLETVYGGQTNASWMITDAAGRAICQGILQPGRQRIAFPANLPHGFYLFRITEKNGSTAVKRIVH